MVSRLTPELRRIRPLVFQIRGLAKSRGSYALEAERKMGQLLELAKKNTGLRALGRFAIPGLLRQHAKDSAVETDGTVHLGYFFPLAWSTAAFSSGSLISDKVRSNSWPPTRTPPFRILSWSSQIVTP